MLRSGVAQLNRHVDSATPRGNHPGAQIEVWIAVHHHADIRDERGLAGVDQRKFAREKHPTACAPEVTVEVRRGAGLVAEVRRSLGHRVERPIEHGDNLLHRSLALRRGQRRPRGLVRRHDARIVPYVAAWRERGVGRWLIAEILAQRARRTPSGRGLRSLEARRASSWPHAASGKTVPRNRG